MTTTSAGHASSGVCSLRDVSLHHALEKLERSLQEQGVISDDVQSALDTMKRLQRPSRTTKERSKTKGLSPRTVASVRDNSGSTSVRPVSPRRSSKLHGRRPRSSSPH